MSILLLTSRPLDYRSESILNDHLASAGIRRQDVRLAEVGERGLTARGDITLIVTLGHQAANMVLGEEWGPKDVEMRRGYLYESLSGKKVLVTVPPDLIDSSWVPWSALFGWDLRKAKKEAAFPEIRRPVREVVIV